MTELTFHPYPKTPRLYREAVITEKIDGTNAAVVVLPWHEDKTETNPSVVWDGTRWWLVYAQSRKRVITPEDDNHGFARWVYENAGQLVSVLGEGVHFGEWWGSGIQRGYGLANGDKRFSLFNVGRWADLAGNPLPALASVPGLSTVPLMARGEFAPGLVPFTVAELRQSGSHAAPGFMRPEGVVLFHTAARQVFKVLLEGDNQPKGISL